MKAMNVSTVAGTSPIDPGVIAVSLGRRKAVRGKAYVEFELEPGTLLEVEALARQTGCTPFDMCIKLVEEKLSGVSEP
jgi:hypothetical protein